MSFHLFVGDLHAYRPDDCLQVVHSLVAAVAAVADYHGGFTLPLIVQVVDGVLQLGRDAPVALRGNEDERVQVGDAAGSGAGVFVDVLVCRLDMLGDARFIEKREAVRFEVDEVKPAVVGLW